MLRALVFVVRQVPALQGGGRVHLNDPSVASAVDRLVLLSENAEQAGSAHRDRGNPNPQRRSVA